MTHIIRVLSSPNNETRITMYPAKRKSKSLREIVADFLCVPSSEVEEKITTRKDVDREFPLLDIRSEFKTVCVAHSYNRTKFGKNAKTRLMRAGGAMDKTDGCPWHYLFLTATLPSNDEWAKWALAEHSDWVINTIKAWLSKRCKDRREFYVWEMQERGALHFHWAIWLPEESVRNSVAEEFRLEWCRILEGVGKRSSVCMWGRFNYLSPTAKYCLVQVKVETIRKSVAAYMAGYVGGKKDKHSKDCYIPYYPRRWFGVSRPLSATIEALSEQDEYEYNSLADAKTAFEAMGEYFYEDSVQSKKWCHTVGTGESSVHYHTPEKHKELWQGRKAVKFNKSKYPNVWSLIYRTVFITRTHMELLTNSQHYRQLCSNAQLDCLSDALYLQSAQRGSLRDVQVGAIERLFTVLSSQSTLAPSLNRQLTSVRKFCHFHSQMFSLMSYDRNGWLTLGEDLPGTVDSIADSCHTRTTSDEDGTQDVEGVANGSLSPQTPSTLYQTCLFLDS